MGLGILGVGGATRRNKTFATSTGSYKRLCTDSTTDMLDEALRGCSCCCSKSLMACFAFPLLIGTAAGILLTVLLTSSSLVFNMEALQQPLYKSACFSGYVFICKAAAEVLAQRKQQSWVVLLHAPWWCLLSLQVNSSCRRSLDLGYEQPQDIWERAYGNYSLQCGMCIFILSSSLSAKLFQLWRCYD